MADLTNQDSIKLLTAHKFRISLLSTARTKRSQTSHDRTNFTQRKGKTEVQQQNQMKPRYPETKKFKQALLNIGALQKQNLRFTFEPDEADHKQFRTTRLNSLKAKFFRQKFFERKQKPYDDEMIDEAAIDCWKYGEYNGQKGIWKKYKDNLNKLNFDTLKAIKKRRSIF